MIILVIFITFTGIIFGSTLLVDLYNNVHSKYALFDQTLYSLERDIGKLREDVNKLHTTISRLSDQMINHNYDLSKSLDTVANKTPNTNDIVLLQMQQEDFQIKMILELSNIKHILNKLDTLSEDHSMRCHGGSFGCFSDESSRSLTDNQDYLNKESSANDSSNPIDSVEPEDLEDSEEPSTEP